MFTDRAPGAGDGRRWQSLELASGAIRACWRWDRGIEGGWVTWVMEINMRGGKRERYQARGREKM